MLLDGAKDAYEVSFVAVPAQPRAGTTKSIGFTKPVEEPTEEPTEEKNILTDDKDIETSKRLDEAVSFFNSNFKEDN